MTRYRRDQSLTNEHGQTLYYALWMGGPSLSAVGNCDCSDGVRRSVDITGEADTYFSLPAKTKVRGKNVTGFVTCDNGRYVFHATGKNRGLLPDPEKGKVGDLVRYTEGGEMRIGRVIGFTEKDGMGEPYVDERGCECPRLVVLQLSDDMTTCYVRHVDRDTVTSRADPFDPSFHAWFFGGPIAGTEALLVSERYGSLNTRYFAQSCNPDGSLKPRLLRSGQ